MRSGPRARRSDRQRTHGRPDRHRHARRPRARGRQPSRLGGDRRGGPCDQRHHRQRTAAWCPPIQRIDPYPTSGVRRASARRVARDPGDRAHRPSSRPGMGRARATRRADRRPRSLDRGDRSRSRPRSRNRQHTRVPPRARAPRDQPPRVGRRFCFSESRAQSSTATTRPFRRQTSSLGSLRSTSSPPRNTSTYQSQWQLTFPGRDSRVRRGAHSGRCQPSWRDCRD